MVPVTWCVLIDLPSDHNPIPRYTSVEGDRLYKMTGWIDPFTIPTLARRVYLPLGSFSGETTPACPLVGMRYAPLSLCGKPT